MSCPACQSLREQSFNGEVAIHFPGVDGLNKPIVWVFPELSICLDCGKTQFTIPERELEVLIEGKPIDGAVVLWEKPAAKAAGDE